MDTTKQGHLIERAAARLRSPMLQPTPTSRAPTVGEVTRLQEPPRRATAGDQPEPPPKTPIGITALMQAGLIVNGADAYSRTAEEFRIIQNRVLRQSLNEGTPAQMRHLVMVTSALKGEGKSFTAINLAAEVARHRDRRVLLVDVDPKAGGLRHKLGIPSAIGLLDLARSDRVDPEEVIIPTELEFLDFLPIGTDVKGSGELLASKRLTKALVELGRRYPDRLIVFDAPPCLGSSIPHTLAAAMGQIIIVVGAGSTQQQDVEAALELVQSCPQISLLLNKIPVWSAHSFGSYSYLAA